MTDIFKCLAQLAPAAGVETILYTAPVSRSVVVSSLWVCNQSAETTFSVRINIGGAANAPKQLLFSNTTIEANDSLVAVSGITLAAGDVVKVTSVSGSVSFMLFGDEIA